METPPFVTYLLQESIISHSIIVVPDVAVHRSSTAVESLVIVRIPSRRVHKSEQLVPSLLSR